MLNMINSGAYGFIFYIALLAVVSEIAIEANADVNTKLLLQNIRSHLTQRAEEIIQPEEYESGSKIGDTFSNYLAKDLKGVQENPSEKIFFRSENTIGRKSTFKSGGRVLRKEDSQADQIKEKYKWIHLNKRRKIPVRQSKIFQPPILSHDWEKVSNDLNNISENQKAKKQKAKIKTFSQKVERKPKEIKNKKITFDKPNGKQSAEKIQKSKPVAAAQNNHDYFNVNKRRNNDEKQKPQIKEKLKKSFQLKPKVKYSLPEEKRRKTCPTFPPTENLFFNMEASEIDKIYINETCRKHKSIYLNQLKMHKIWALMMLDASAKLPSGILQGNVNQYGDFDECLSINAVFKKPKVKEPKGIRGKYCLANVHLTADSTESERLYMALERAKSFSFFQSTIKDPSHFIPRFTSINWGLCVPDTCSSKDVEVLIRQQLNQLNFAKSIDITVNVLENNCVVKSDLNLHLTKSMMGVLGFYAIVVAIACYATYLDLRKSKSKMTQSGKNEMKIMETFENMHHVEEILPQNHGSALSLEGKLKQVIMAFSLKRNLKRLLKEEEEEEEIIACIFGIKSVCSFMLFLTLKMIPLGWTAFSNKITLTKMSNEAPTILLRIPIIYMDSFLLMSGLLTAYSLSREVIAKGKIRLKRRIVLRYLRLTPTLLAVLLFYAHVWDQTGSGPLWNALVKQNAKLCQAHFWRNLLYIQNFFPFEYMCAPHTYQLALNMQLTALAPLFVHILFHFDKVGYGILQALFMLSSIFRYLSVSRNDLSVVVYHGMPVSQLYKTANLFYLRTFHRASPFIMGIIVGYNLQKYRKRIRIPTIFAALGWIMAFACAFYCLVSPSNVASKEYVYNTAKAAHYAALSPVLWSIFLSWMIVACHLGVGGLLNKFLCNKALLIFSRISYSFNLILFVVFFYKVGVERMPEVFTFAKTLDIKEFFLLIVISTIVTFIFDSPVAEIQKIILNESQCISPTNIILTDATDSKTGINRFINENLQQVQDLRLNELFDEEENVKKRTIDEELEEVSDDSFGFGINDDIDNMENRDSDVEEGPDDFYFESDEFERLETLSSSSSDNSLDREQFSARAN